MNAAISVASTLFAANVSMGQWVPMPGTRYTSSSKLLSFGFWRPSMTSTLARVRGPEMTALRHSCLTLLLSLAIGSSAMAQDRKAAQAIKHRRAAFVLMSTYFSRLLQTVEGGRPFDAAQVVRDAKLVEDISRLPWEGFAPGTEHGDTRAKEDIWLDEDRFKAMAAKLQTKTSELSRAAASGSLSNLKMAFEQTRDACDACHKEYRKK